MTKHDNLRLMISRAVDTYNLQLAAWKRVATVSKYYPADNRSSALNAYIRAKAYLNGLVDAYNEIYTDKRCEVVYHNPYEFDEPIDKVMFISLR